MAVIDDNLTDEERARLHDDIAASMSEFDRGEGIPAAQVVTELRVLSRDDLSAGMEQRLPVKA